MGPISGPSGNLNRPIWNIAPSPRFDSFQESALIGTHLGPNRYPFRLIGEPLEIALARGTYLNHWGAHTPKLSISISAGGLDTAGAGSRPPATALAYVLAHVLRTFSGVR